MWRNPSLILTGLVLLAGCTALQITPQKAPPAAVKWSGNLVAPTGAGGGTMSGSVTMSPGTEGTSVSIVVENGVPGSVHRWALHQGHCGSADLGVLGTADAYKSLTVGANGRGMSSTTLSVLTPMSGDYFAIVHTSTAAATAPVACGNLTLPAQ